MTERCSVQGHLLQVFQSSALLIGAVPRVRLLAICEAIRAAGSDDAAAQTVLENLATSPFIPPELKGRLAELVFTSDWPPLYAAMKCSEGGGLFDHAPGTPPQDKVFREYRAMVTSIFAKSRKVQLADPERRRLIGMQLHKCTCESQLKAACFASLEAQIQQDQPAFDAATRMRVANDVLDGRYDLLLMEDRFDCDDTARLGGSSAAPSPTAPPAGGEEEGECALCLGAGACDTLLPCAHAFCRRCVTDWASKEEGPNFSCPLCRTEHRKTVIT